MSLRTICALMVVLASGAHAQEPASQTAASTSSEGRRELRAPDPDKWWFEVSPYLWGSAIKTEADIGDVSAETEMDFSDVFDMLDGAIMLHGEAHKDRWGIFTDVMWSRISDDEDIGPQNAGEIEVEMEESFVELGGMYRFGPQNFSFEALFGARAAFLSTDIDITGGNGGDADVDNNQTLVGPLVGGRLIYRFNSRWFTSLRADVSGFEIEDHWIWNATGLVGYRFTELFSMALGYRYMVLDFEDGNLEVEQTLHGPVIGFGFRFGGK